MFCCNSIIFIIIITLISIVFVLTFIKKKKRVRRLKKWESETCVIVHTIPAGKTIVNLSPYVVKLLTYLRMANIPYKIDNDDPMYFKTGKTPWISYKEDHLSDSELIIQFLEKKFKPLKEVYSEEKLAIGNSVRIMLEEYFYWGLILWRYVYSDIERLKQIFDMEFKPEWLIKRILKMMMTNKSNSQGLGRLPKDKVFSLTLDSLKYTSSILKNNKFFLGDTPSKIDAAIFGSLSMCLWATQGSPYETIVNEELINLKEYCLRMKELYWKDWDSCLAKKDSTIKKGLFKLLLENMLK